MRFYHMPAANGVCHVLRLAHLRGWDRLDYAILEVV